MVRTIFHITVAFFCISNFAFAALPSAGTKFGGVDSALSSRINAIENGLNVLQKYVYNLNAAQFSNVHSTGKSVDNAAVSMDEIGEQFQAFRSDIESLRYEVNLINDKLLKFAHDIEQRLSDVESPIKESDKNSAIIDQVESQLNEVEMKAVSSSSVGGNLRHDFRVAEQFKRAYLLLKDRSYADAVTAFEGFVANNPSSTLVGAAHFWIGEICMKKEEYDKAAVEYLKGYQADPSSGRAPDNLLGLSESLFKIGKRHEACVTAQKLNKSFPNASASIKRKSASLMKEAMCFVK